MQYSEGLGSQRADLPRGPLALGINITRPTVLRAAYDTRTGQAILGEPLLFGEDMGCEAVSPCGRGGPDGERGGGLGASLHGTLS